MKEKINSVEYFNRIKRLPRKKGRRFSVMAIVHKQIMSLANYDRQLNIVSKKRNTWPQQMKRLLP